MKKNLTRAFCLNLLLFSLLFTAGCSGLNTSSGTSNTGTSQNSTVNNGELTALTQEDIITGSALIVKGTVIGHEYISELNKTKYTISVSETYKGNSASEKIEFLVPGMYGDENASYEDSDIMSLVNIGDIGIFILNSNNGITYSQAGGKEYSLSDYCDYSMGDGRRYVFVEKDGSLKYDKDDTYTFTASGLKDAADYLIFLLKK